MSSMMGQTTMIDNTTLPANLQPFSTSEARSKEFFGALWHHATEATRDDWDDTAIDVPFVASLEARPNRNNYTTGAAQVRLAFVFGKERGFFADDSGEQDHIKQDLVTGSIVRHPYGIAVITHPLAAEDVINTCPCILRDIQFFLKQIQEYEVEKHGSIDTTSRAESIDLLDNILDGHDMAQYESHPADGKACAGLARHIKPAPMKKCNDCGEDWHMSECGFATRAEEVALIGPVRHRELDRQERRWVRELKLVHDTLWQEGWFGLLDGNALYETHNQWMESQLGMGVLRRAAGL